MEAVSAQVKANKKHDIALLLVTFGVLGMHRTKPSKGMKETIRQKVLQILHVLLSFTSEI